MGVGLVVAGGVVAAAWVLVVLVLAAATRPRRPRPAPAVPGRPEPPAVAALLAGGGRLPGQAWAGTLVDLAARGWYRIVPGPDGGLRCLATPPGPAAAGGLVGYEQAALTHVRGRLAATGGAPPSALGSGQADGAADGWARFRDGVVAETGRLGLVRPRVGRPVIALLRVAALVPGVLVFLAVHVGEPGAGGVAVGLFFGYLTFGVLAFPVLAVLRGVRPTRTGAAAGAQWRGAAAALRQDPAVAGAPAAALAAPAAALAAPRRAADRRLGYAVALGAAPELAAAFDPPPSDTVWSSYGGRWRTVRRGSPAERMVTNPALVALVALWAVLFVAGMTAFARFSGSAYGPLIVLAATAVAGLALLLTVRALLANLRRPSALTVDGQVVDSWVLTGDADTPDRHCLAIDDGRSDPAWSLAVPPATRARYRVGDQVRLRVDARRNRLLEITPLAPRAPAPPPPPG